MGVFPEDVWGGGADEALKMMLSSIMVGLFHENELIAPAWAGAENQQIIKKAIFEPKT